MNLRPDVHSAVWIFAVVLVGFWGWRTLAGLAASQPSTESIGKAMLSISG